MSVSRPAVVVLAAGEGTRMRSRTPKVLHPLLGRPLLGHVLAAAAPLSASSTTVVVGHGRAAVARWLAENEPQIDVVVQHDQHGTGHAVRIALEHLMAAAAAQPPTVVVLCGDTPLLTAESLQQLVEAHRARGAAATVLTATVADPTGYGRVVRDGEGAVLAIVEQPDADETTRRIDEINSGLYAFERDPLVAALSRLGRDNSQGEEYLTDVVALLRDDGLPVAAHRIHDANEVMGVNDRAQLAVARALLRDRVNAHWMAEGAGLVDPSSTWIDVGVTLAADCVVQPNTMLRGTTTVGADAEVGPGSVIVDSRIGEGATVTFTTATNATIGDRATVGPYTYLRPGTVLGPDTRAGAFVEMKNSTLDTGAKVPHLSYVGDAEIGEGTNIGAATIFVNYDGVAKHRTVVGRHARIGSDSMLVAPVTIGDGAYTAAGSVITDDVPAGAMAVARGKQRTVLGWVARRRAGSASAVAAAQSSPLPPDVADSTTPQDGERDDSVPTKGGPAA
ncbi:MAG: bifunctional UDP-N-acetylglucosamine diphosphorylase/glucosamine-1-phosphate N-acetyltransferase GlmU [Actinomycetes bacterium]